MRLPLTKTLIAVTFITGMLPVIGNLISNLVAAPIVYAWVKDELKSVGLV